MPRKVFEGNLIAKEDSFAILVSRWNDLITSRLLEGALDSLKRHGVDVDDPLTRLGTSVLRVVREFLYCWPQSTCPSE